MGIGGQAAAMVAWLGVFFAFSAADVLDEVTRQQPGRAMRFSTGVFDPESNNDAYFLSPGQRKTFARLEGPGEIRHIWFTVSGEFRWTRSIVLRIYWDDSDVPSVETPLGDFFAAGNGMRANVSTVPLEVTSYGRALNSYWHMPFRRSARVELTNEGKALAGVYCQIDWMKFDALPDSTLYFHARYKQECPRMPFEPYVIFEGQGQGQYVGTVFSSQSALAHWAGEADDLYFIDGEEQPSLVGTGTEDWLTDAWNTRVFTNANAGVTIKEPNGVDCRFTAYRWHLQAPVTFHKSLRVEYERRSFITVTDPATGKDIEMPFKYRPDFLSSVAIWYQKGVAEPFCAFPPVQDRLNPEIIVSTRERTERLPCSDDMKRDGHAERVMHGLWYMGLRNDKVSAWVDLPFTIKDEGQYSLSAFPILFRNCGIWKVTLLGPGVEIVLDPELDLFDTSLALKEHSPENIEFGTRTEKKLGIVRLVPGKYRMRFTCIGSNPLSTTGEFGRRGYNLGLNFISLRKLPWDHMDQWLKKYLVKERAIVAERDATARRTVDALAAAVAAFHRERGAYPARLDDLLTTRGQNGKPFFDATRIPVDPWRQPYQYACPGRYRPESFDLYSMRGDSTDPSHWITSWTADDLRIPGAIEGEALRVIGGSEGASAHPQVVWTRSIPPTSGGTVLFIDFARRGGTMALALPESVKPGRYRVTLHLLKSWDYADVQWSIDGKRLGEPAPGHSPEIVRTVVDAGEITLGDGPHTLQAEALDADPTMHRFCAGLDAVVLEAVE
ncbi:MAG: DUF2961 domain-containing protein [Pirellulales bacterium]|nr:DUF2961 domain-containing protein [Pirellulales bacterium]